MSSIIDVNNFWIDILIDHMSIIKLTLSSNETEIANYVDYIINQLKDVYDNSIARRDVEERALYLAMEVKRFKINVLSKMLDSKIQINISSTYVNHMLNENNEYIDIFLQYKDQNVIIKHPLEVHKLWIKGAIEHAGLLISGLDDVEYDIKKDLKYHKKKFAKLYDKCEEFIEYYNKTRLNFAAINKFNLDAESQMKLFIKLLDEIYENKMQDLIIGNIEPFIINHMLKEEKYYLKKIMSFPPNHKYYFKIQEKPDFGDFA